MKQIENFVQQFNASIIFDKELLVRKGNRYFLLNKDLKKLVRKDFFYCGIYLGKTKKGKFFPSFNLLKMISEQRANKIIVNKKAEWLFICGRDVFREGILKVAGSKKQGDYALILNQNIECLGFGRIANLSKENGDVAVKNILDIGDFLRREKQRS